ncbi:unnamed protein product [Rotaria sordida]|uniref:RING-type domain-containing protein n=1 Tax=Rotaria sordida TaxID=392033 RepID=A0A819ABT5_9BILA|nr:unnamed protein product [Rotaria sordida]
MVSVFLLGYRYYDQSRNKVTNFTGYTTDINKISVFLNDLQRIGGADISEATKTALDMNLIDSNAIVLIYTDAPPHHPKTGGSNWAQEEKNVKEKDWVQLCQLYQETGCKVFSMINDASFETSSFYILLSQYTRGKTLYLKKTDIKTISKCTINLSLSRRLKFSLRPAAIVGMICVLSKNGILHERARHFLTRIKGQWLDLELPENCTYAFSKLCVKLPEFFTENENLFFQKLYTIGGLKINAATCVNIEQPFIPSVKEIYHDAKIQCKTCHFLRSTTLFPDVGTSCCALCLPQHNLKDIPEPCTGYSSPKCYYCRDLFREAPYRRCARFQNKYIHYDSTESAPNHGKEYTFLCAECQHSITNKVTVDIPVSIDTLINENKVQLFKYLNIKVKDDIDILSTAWSLFKSKDKVEFGKTEDINLVSFSSSIMPLVHRNKSILNSTAVFNQIQTWIQSGKSEWVTCYICCDDFPRNKINDTCGNKLCHAEACTECLMKWYQAVQPGSIVLTAHLLCPFCKHVPNGKILKKYNKQVCTILRSDKKDDIDEHWYYGWRIDCYKVKKAREKSCMEDGNIPLLTDFVCDECDEIRRMPKNITVKYCPGINERTKQICGIAINKNGGCNHITCTACDAHWCWLCVKTYGDRIYEHLTAVHVCVAIVSSDSEHNIVRIVNSGSTNTAGYTIELRRDGIVQWTVAHRRPLLITTPSTPSSTTSVMSIRLSSALTNSVFESVQAALPLNQFPPRDVTIPISFGIDDVRIVTIPTHTL